MHRMKKNYYCVGIISFLITLSCLYYWKRNAWNRAIEEFGHPSKINSNPNLENGCLFPDLDPFSEVAMKYNVDMPKVVCVGEDWVVCNMSTCQVTQHILKKMRFIECQYKDIIYIDEYKYMIADPVTVYNDDVFKLNMSDFFQVSCYGYDKYSIFPFAKRWHGYKSGIRPISPPLLPHGRENSINVLILGFDSTSRYGFIRKMPKSYKFLTDELQAVILKGYNIVGDGTADALFPILSGRNELQHPYARQRYSKDIYLDPNLFIFHTAKQDGYQTAYYEDMPWIGSFQYRYNGFNKQPADHYLRSFFMEETKEGRKWWRGINGRYCIGDTPQYLFLLNLTRQFMNLPTKRFCFTFIADISHDEPNLLSTADDDVVDFLKHLKISGKLDDTLLIVMGDHGPRFSPMRVTYQGKIEERMPFMSIILPGNFKHLRPDASFYLKLNSEVLSTPFDIHTTILDAMGLKDFASDFVVMNSIIPRGLSLLEEIPKTRTCDEADILPHWCVCLNTKWYNVEKTDRLYRKVGDSLTEFINNITEEERSLCAERKLTSIEWIIRRDPSDKIIYGTSNVYYQAMIVMSPGRAVYEATVQYNTQTDKFIISDKDVSRISPYGNVPACISATHPHLNKYCYCKNRLSRSFNIFMK